MVFLPIVTNKHGSMTFLVVDRILTYEFLFFDNKNM